MPKPGRLYTILFVISFVFVVYAVYVNFIYDPQAAGFLSHKTDLKRPLNVPVWLKIMNVHVVFACIAMLSGLINFSNRIIAKHRKFHRINGYLYLVSVIMVDLTSGFMAPYSTGGKLNSIAFNMLNIVWLLMTVTAIVQIRKKQVVKHRKWMIRSYAFCFTNMCIHLITAFLHDGFGIAYSTSYTIGVYGTIVLLPIAAEVVIRTVFRKPPLIAVGY
ncbi:DUF2306 domain-containing protein [Paenibacillus thalictri]|uniref:DUF2306 domain-containing protein n=1 Tax=Paenibacillus thalictri TaxID=2527873 RepID=A0A4Q9DHV5_9BACL|nr:DUF2306 domain-containing protein [Paenibacillus thalictri]TBL72646.1 DUF2306 domain-containing protein [Paenibacillus thalictri]